MTGIRVLLLADTHLGFDQPRNPRVEKRRRGPDFWANYQRALEPARRGEVDLVVHGGDLLFRSKVRGDLVLEAFAPLKAIADRGIPVVLVPGNHERSHIPFPLFGHHPGIHVFDRPQTFVVEISGQSVGLSGFPNVRRGIDKAFPKRLAETRWQDHSPLIRILCLHQTVEGAKVGPADYTFRRGEGIIRARDLPQGFAAVLAGHIHRHQVLTRDLRGDPLPLPVYYPGSIERTSWAEQAETKGFLLLDIESHGEGGTVTSGRFVELPARPMIEVKVSSHGSPKKVQALLRSKLHALPHDAVVRVRVEGGSSRSLGISAAELRSLGFPTQTVEALP